MEAALLKWSNLNRSSVANSSNKWEVQNTFSGQREVA